ncbi:MAG: TolC family protein [Candidatus Eisenbacteria bacterium]
MIARAEVLEQNTRAFVDLLAAQQHLTLADELVEVAEEALASIARRVEAGATSPVEQSRAQVELEISRIERTRIAQMLATRRSVLASIWGDDAPRFGEALGDLESVPEVSSLEDLQHRVSEGPAIVRWSAERKRRESELAWQRSQGTPNLSMGAGVRYLRESEDTALIVELGLPLPIFDRNRDAVRAAALRLDRLDGERSAAVAELQSEVSEAYGALRTAADEAEALRSRAIPPAEVAFQAAREASLRGAMRFTDVLDTERMLFELRGRYYDALADLHTAHANLERILGAPILPHASGSEEDPR